MEIMSQTKPLLAFTRRGALVLALACSLGPSALGRSSGGGTAPRPPVATSVRAVTSGAATLITISGTAPMPYAVRKPEPLLLVVELPGVDGSQLAQSYDVASPLVGGVTVRRALREGEPLASLNVALRAPVRERARLEGSQLVLELLPDEVAEAPQARPTPTPSNPNQTPQVSQGAQYGQPNFVGEPISLNVVNADIRDILNYI